MNLVLILGNQLFSPKLWLDHIKAQGDFIVFMREDQELCTYYRFHKHKIIFFLAAMRHYADELKQQKIKVHYENLNPKEKDCFEEKLLDIITQKKIRKIFIFEIEDKFFEKRILNCLENISLEKEIITSPLFLTSRENFSAYLKKNRKPFMKTFYEDQRKKLNILIDSEKNPTGGKWSFDEDNRLKLPADLNPPSFANFPENKITQTVKKICDEFFADHLGSSENFWLPVTRSDAEKWLAHFLKNKLHLFGPYEDALAIHSDFVFHSILTPFLNTGLLTPNDVIEKTLEYSQHHHIPLNSLEGFIRQIIGWREFIHGIYQNFSDQQETTNFWQHNKKLSPTWYTATSGIPQLDRTLKKVIDFGYAHHIERLMVLGNLMLLLEIHPHEAHRWFMEMFIDSSDWVMGPNVYGMALFSDGGIFATKPYICGSNYWRKMSGEKSDVWCDAIDGLYWQFIEKNKMFFAKNPRLSMMTKTLEKMSADRKQSLFQAAKILQNKLTEPQ